MKAPILRLSRAEIVKLYTGRCTHGHRYLEHYDCYLREEERKIKIGFFDIETSNLRADFSILFTYAIKTAGENEIVSSAVTRDELLESLDRAVVKRAVADLRRYDLIITYYGTKFDIPFLRTRAEHWGLNFPTYGEIQHKDAYYIVKSKLNLSRNRLESADRLLFGKTRKTHIDSQYWLKAWLGDEESLGYISNHNKKDVLILERVYNRLRVYVKNQTKSM